MLCFKSERYNYLNTLFQLLLTNNHCQKLYGKYKKNALQFIDKYTKQNIKIKGKPGKV